mmetsp:Transcript_45463/g.134459  ORF Transcript_45463/g.134459 Transcript_45463/m.134459 type:complete len:203 (-) Transcript_45463:344-952(-)
MFASNPFAAPPMLTMPLMFTHTVDRGADELAEPAPNVSFRDTLTVSVSKRSHDSRSISVVDADERCALSPSRPMRISPTNGGTTSVGNCVGSGCHHSDVDARSTPVPSLPARAPYTRSTGTACDALPRRAVAFRSAAHLFSLACTCSRRDVMFTSPPRSDTGAHAACVSNVRLPFTRSSVPSNRGVTNADAKGPSSGDQPPP